MKPVYPPFLYRFLGTAQRFSGSLCGKKILDCGAGGARPPLVLFAEYGLDCCGIDISGERLTLAQNFAVQQGYPLKLREGDMRRIPFEDQSFDLVYEYYALCHLRKRDILVAIEEMRRVLKPGGLLFLGFMSADTWPLTGRPNEFNEWQQVENGEEVVHSVFFDQETTDFIYGFEVLLKETERRVSVADLQQQSLAEWMAEYREDWFYDREEWEEMYTERLLEANYSHIFYLLRRPIE